MSRAIVRWAFCTDAWASASRSLSNTVSWPKSSGRSRSRAVSSSASWALGSPARVSWGTSSCSRSPRLCTWVRARETSGSRLTVTAPSSTLMPSIKPSPESSRIKAEWARSTASVISCCTSGLPSALVNALSTNVWAPAASVGAIRSRLAGSTLVTLDSTSTAANTSLVTHVASPAETSGSDKADDTMSPTLSESNTVALAHTPISASVRQTTARTPQIVATTLRHAGLSSVEAGSSTTSSATSAVIPTASRFPRGAASHSKGETSRRTRWRPLGYCARRALRPPG